MKWMLIMAACGLFAVSNQEAALEAASRGYDEEFIDLVEWVYGKSFLSQGGEASVEKLTAPFDLDGKRLLDIGSGLGGPAITLAKNHAVHVVGIEPQKGLVRRANHYLEEAMDDLLGSVEFVAIEDPSNLSIFDDASFDYIISKEAILHIPTEMKESYFYEIYRTLKPGGRIAIMDWLHKTPNYSPNTQKMIEIDGVAYNMVTGSEYHQILSKTGFIDIRQVDETEENISNTTNNLLKIATIKEKIINRYDEETYDFCITSWNLQKKAFTSRELMTAIFYARKSN